MDGPLSLEPSGTRIKHPTLWQANPQVQYRNLALDTTQRQFRRTLILATSLPDNGVIMAQVNNDAYLIVT
jgi:hypothetical protein